MYSSEEIVRKFKNQKTNWEHKATSSIHYAQLFWSFKRLTRLLLIFLPFYATQKWFIYSTSNIIRLLELELEG